jgi:mycofactocin precursor
MSRSAAEDQRSDQENRRESDADTEDDPKIEEDLLQEELRIDGICGVY